MSRITRAYSEAVDQNQRAQDSDLRRQATMMQIYQTIAAQQAQQDDAARNEALRAEIAALPPEKRNRENVLPIIMKHARGARDIVAALPEAPKGQPIGSGGLRMPDGTVVPPAARPDAAAPKPPATRQRYDGTNVIQEELQPDGTWRQIGTGPRFAPERPQPQPKPPTGFRYKQGTGELEPIPGGPKDTSGKDAARAQGAVQKADIVIRKVDEALSQTGFFSTGLTGSAMGLVPGTKAYDLDKTIDTIKANLGFSELQAMREASPTGGALGQVAIQELAMLQSTVASLEKGQSEGNLRRGLSQVKHHFERWKKAVMEANAGAVAAPGGGGGTPASPPPSVAPSASGWTVRQKP